MVVEPGHPFQRSELDGLPGFPGCPAANQLGLVQTVDGLGQGVVIAVTLAAHGRLDAGLGQSLGVADADVLRAPVGVADQASIAFGLPGVQGLLQRVNVAVWSIRAHRDT